MTEMNIQKMEEMMKNEAFAQKVSEAGSYEAVYELFAGNGLDASYEDFLAYIQDSQKFMEEKGLITEEGELSPEMLDLVSGGSARGKAILTLAAIACLCAGHPGFAIGCFLLAAMH